MRTPGHDEELALGFCLSEGLRPEAARLPDDLAANTVEVSAPGFDPGRLQRSFYTSSSCGVCGKGALEAVAVEAPRVESELTVARRARLVAAGPAARGAAGVRRDRRAARDRPLLGRGRAPVPARGRRPAQRARQGRRLGVRRGPAAARSGDPLRQRTPLVRARAEGGGRRLPRDGRRRCTVEPRRRARGRPRDHALRLRPRRPDERLHGAVADPALTGVLLVGGASERFGSPKALARIDGRTLAEIAWEKLAFCDERIAVGKRADGLELPFPVLDDGIETRAPIAGVVAGLRAAANDLCVVLPVDVAADLAGGPRGARRGRRRRRRPADRPAPGCLSPLRAAGARAPARRRRACSARSARRARHACCHDRPCAPRQREHAR